MLQIVDRTEESGSVYKSVFSHFRAEKLDLYLTIFKR